MVYAVLIIALALYADIFEASGIATGLFGSAYALVRLILVLLLEWKIDLGNSKRYLLIGLGLNVVWFLGLTVVQTIEQVIPLRGFQAVGAIMLWITGVAVVGEIAPEDGRGLWIGTYNQVRSIASLLGDLVGSSLLFLYGFGSTYAVLISITLFSTAAVYLFVRDIALVAFRFSFSSGKMAVTIFLPIYARTHFGMNALLIGGILVGGKLTKGIAQRYVVEFADRFGREEWFIFWGTVGYALGTALIPAAAFTSTVIGPMTLAGLGRELTFVPALFVLFAAFLILGFADSLRLPTSMALFVQEGDYYKSVADSLSLRSVSWQFGGIAGPVIVGAMFDYVSFLSGFWFAAGLMIAAGAIFLGLFEAEGVPETSSVPATDD